MALEITSVTPTPDAGGYKTADVVSSWGNLPIRYRMGEEVGTVHEIHADLAALTLPDGIHPSAAGPAWIAAVAKAILAKG